MALYIRIETVSFCMIKSLSFFCRGATLSVAFQELKPWAIAVEAIGREVSFFLVIACS